MAVTSEPTLQRTFVALIPIEAPDEGALDELRARLSEVDAISTAETASGAAAGTPLNFGSLGGLHFAQLAVLDARVRAGGAPLLLIATRFDDPEAGARDAALLAHARALVAAGGEIWLDVLDYCADAPDALDGLPEYLLRHVVPLDAEISATAGRSVEQIRAEASLKQDLRERLRRAEGLSETSSLDPQLLRHDLVNRVQGLGPFRLPEEDPSRLTLWAAIVALLVIVWLPVTLPLALIYLLFLRWAEARDLAVHAVTPVREQEPGSGPDLVTLLVPVKPGALRRRTLAAVLGVIASAAGALGISTGPLAGLFGFHYAAWARIDGGRELLFVAVSDPGAGLQDLRGLLLHGVNAIWSNTQGFPRTAWLAWGGAFDRDSFVAWLRQHLVASSIEYAAYPNLSARAIVDNTDVRRGLADVRSQVRVRHWLAKIHA